MIPEELPEGFTTEPCPHCNGTGQRLVAPPPDKRGGQKPRGVRHGYASTYSAGCRCDFCKAAWRQYRRIEKERKKAVLK